MSRALAGYIVDLGSGIGGGTRMVAFDSNVTLESIALGALDFRVTGKKSAVIRWLKKRGALSVVLAAELQGGQGGAPSDSGSSNSSSSASTASTSSASSSSEPAATAAPRARPGLKQFRVSWGNLQEANAGNILKKAYWDAVTKSFDFGVLEKAGTAMNLRNLVTGGTFHVTFSAGGSARGSKQKMFGYGESLREIARTVEESGMAAQVKRAGKSGVRSLKKKFG